MSTILAGTGLKVERSNSRYAVCHCPYPEHKDRHASSVVYLDNFWFVCFRCHVSKPLEAVLRETGHGTYTFERADNPKDFNPVLFDESVRYGHLTPEALGYLVSRGIQEQYAPLLPTWVASPVDNRGVGFVFQNNGKRVGMQIRLFPAMMVNPAVRYVLQGKRLPWFGDLDRTKQVVCFEKAFATLKAHLVAQEAGLPLSIISSVGSNFQKELLDIVPTNTLFFFDNDTAGRTAAQKVKRAGFRVFVPHNPFDDFEMSEVRRVLEDKCIAHGTSPSVGASAP